MGNYYIVGTAGHIDHGKSSLVEKLTGTNPDRLIEEKKRGITIDLGFAYLYSDDVILSFIDVPGHEGFIKNMIAGAAGFDICLMAIDCLELIMPQTIEHTNIVNLLGIKDIIIAITKCDKIKSEQICEAKKKIQDFLEPYNFNTISILPVSIFDNLTIDNLKKTLINACKTVIPKSNSGPFLLHIDRKFTVKGIGTVITGTALKGTIKKNETLQHLPSEKPIRIKNIQVHNKDTSTAAAGARVAINLAGIELDSIERGDTLCTPLSARQVSKAYAYIKVFNNLKMDISITNNKTYPIYIGTEHLSGKIILQKTKQIKASSGCFALITFDRKYPVYYKEPFIIRGYSPQTSIGGGQILSITNYNLDKNNLSQALSYLYNDNYEEFVKILLENNEYGLYIPDNIQFTHLQPQELENLVKKLNIEIFLSTQYGLTSQRSNQQHFYTYLIKKEQITKLLKEAISELESKGTIKIAQLRINLKQYPEALIKTIEKQLIQYALSAGFTVKADIITKIVKSEFEVKAFDILEAMKRDINLSNASVLSEKLNIKEDTIKEYLKFLLNKEVIIKIDDRDFMEKLTFKNIIEKIEDLVHSRGYIDVQILKETLQLSRKFLIAFLEFLDKNGRYVNKDNKRYLKVNN